MIIIWYNLNLELHVTVQAKDPGSATTLTNRLSCVKVRYWQVT